MLDKEKIKEYVQFHFKRGVCRFYKNQLFILEDLKNNRYNIERDYPLLRKKILDDGNDLIRDIESYFEKIDIFLKDYEKTED